MATRVLSIEITEGIKDLDGMEGYKQALVLVRREGHPVGKVVVPCEKGLLKAKTLWEAIEANGELCWILAQNSIKEWLLKNQPDQETSLPSWSVVICTRDRSEDLKVCLEGMMKLKASGGEILVVDNASADDRTAQVVAQYPSVRYTREDRPGLNWARTHGARVATGDIVIYTDDDVVVDPSWVDGMLEPFTSPLVGAASGLTMPYELENKTQEIFEFNYGGFSKGFQRITYDFMSLAPAAADRIGAGANMAFRRELVNRLQLFAVEMDCGTIAKTGGDLYGFYKVLAQGYQIVYTPDGLIWHRHRREYKNLRNTLYNYRVGGASYLTRCLLQHGDWQAIRVGMRWIKGDFYQIRRALKRSHGHLPLELAAIQLWAIPEGIKSYFASRKIEHELPLTNPDLVSPVEATLVKKLESPV